MSDHRSEHYEHERHWIAARDTAYAQRNNDLRREASPMDHSDEIPMLERVLAGDLSSYTPAGVRTMRDRLVILKAQAGLLPLAIAAE